MSYLCKTCDKIVTEDSGPCPYCGPATPPRASRGGLIAGILLCLAGSACVAGSSFSFEHYPTQTALQVILAFVGIAASAWGAMILGSRFSGDTVLPGIALGLLGLLLILPFTQQAILQHFGLGWTAHVAAGLIVPLVLLAKSLIYRRPPEKSDDR